MEPAMAISDIAKREPGSTRKGPPCTVCALLDSVSDKEAATLVDLLSDPGVRYSWLSQQLAAEGYDIPQDRLARHARGICAARTKLR